MGLAASANLDPLRRFHVELASLQSEGFLAELSPEQVALTRDGLLRVDSLMLCMPKTARCQAPLLGGPGTDLVPLIASTAVIECGLRVFSQSSDALAAFLPGSSA